MEHKNKSLRKVFFETCFEKMMRFSSSGFFELSRPQFNTLHQSQRDDIFFLSSNLQVLLLLSCSKNSTGENPKSANLCATHTYQFYLFYNQFLFISGDSLYLLYMGTYTNVFVKLHKKQRFKTLRFTI